MEPESSHVPLIPGLPDDIALLCLARVPRRYHHALRCVSRRWRVLLCSEEWRLCRQKNNWEETWVYAVCRDKNKGVQIYVLDPDRASRCWRVIQVIETPWMKREGASFETLGKKLYLFGGCGGGKNAVDDVYCYDASANRWETVARMPTARCYSVSTSVNDKLYVMGGLGSDGAAPNSLDVFDSDSNTWSSHESSMLTRNVIKIIPVDEKLYTVHNETQNGYPFAGVYDPLSRSWHAEENGIAVCFYGPTVVIDRTVYMLDQYLGLMVWQEETSWDPLGRLSYLLTRPPCQLVTIGRSIFAIGRGLSTVIADVDTAAKVPGF
uniref:F-box domain-containing protein n=1 Tax=Ananas comosus var. bracteatus TaxID=296719 RepID=A0A6V7QCZ3_ANACO|nr:unnamed protein product [Ananas comosus var. bracteatus]